MELKEVLKIAKEKLELNKSWQSCDIQFYKRVIEIVGENKTLKDQYQAIWRELEKTTKEYISFQAEHKATLKTVLDEHHQDYEELQALKGKYEVTLHLATLNQKKLLDLRTALNNLQLPEEKLVPNCKDCYYEDECNRERCEYDKNEGFNRALKEITEKLEELKKEVTNGE